MKTKILLKKIVRAKYKYKFKLGDVVKVIRLGEVGVIDRINGDGNFYGKEYRINCKKFISWIYANYNEIIKVEKYEGENIMSKFKVGEEVICVKVASEFANGAGWVEGKKFIIDHISEMCEYSCYFASGGSGIYEPHLELVTSNQSNQIKNMNLREIFSISRLSEPNKSYRKAGITDGDDMLTQDGVAIFLNYLLHGGKIEDFKVEVVDEILKQQEKEKK